MYVQYLLLLLDDKNLLARDEFCSIEGELHGKAVLPCRPTNPDIKTKLYKDASNVSSSKCV
jgi:hypothetical protein